MSSKKWINRLTVSFGITVIAGWLFYAAIFYHRISRGEEEMLRPKVERLASQELQEDWFAIYQHGKRTGYSHTELRPQSEGYILSEELLLRLNFLGDIQEIITWVQATLESDFSVKSFTFRLKAGPIHYNLRGGVMDGKLVLVSQMAGQEQIQELQLSHPIYLSSGFKSFLARQRLREGDTYKLALFDPATMSQTVVPLRVEGKEDVTVGSHTLLAYRVVMEFHGVQLKAWVTPYGELLKEEGFLGLTLIRSDGHDAREGFDTFEAADLVHQASVVPDRAIANPRELKRLRVQLTDIPNEGWDLAGGRQHWHNGELSITRESLGEIRPVKIPLGGSELSQDLQPSFLVQSDAPALRDQAIDIVGEEKDGLRATRLLAAWVYQTLDKRPTLSVPNALAVYTLQAGDCNEHSVLFAALARAVGIPTRIVSGLLYSEGRFYYHAWNEVYLGEWLAVDSVMNQIPADPTHIRLIRGGVERQVRLVSLLGRLGIKVMGYE
jgi:transglutaminase-like putative cysteine protease